MAATFSNPRWDALPCELMRGCVFAENFLTQERTEQNNGIAVGSGTSIDRGLTAGGSGYYNFDKLELPTVFSVKVQFKASVAETSTAMLIGNAIGLQSGGTDDGFSVWIDADGVKANHGNGARIAAQCEVDLDYADGSTVHTVTYLADMASGDHSLYVDALAVDTQSTTISEVIGEASTELTVGSGFAGVIYKPRVFTQLLTEDEHDLFHTDSLTTFIEDQNPLAVYRCDSYGDDTDGHYIWDRLVTYYDLTKGDQVDSDTFPTLTTDKYLFDLVDDYVGGGPTLPAAYTVVAAMSTPQEPYPSITIENDATLLTSLKTSGDKWGYLHNLSIYPKVLTQIEEYHAEYQHMYWLSRGRASGIYHRLITEGTCKFAQFLDGDRGIFTNLAPLNDAGLATLVTRGDPASDGCAFGSATSNVTFEHNAAYQCEELTIAVLGDFSANPAGTEVLIDKGTNYKLEVSSAGQISFNGSAIAHTFADNEQIAVVCKPGYEPRFFIDGEYIGEGSTTETPDDSDTTDLVIGNSNELSNASEFDIRQACLCDKPLTDIEIKALYEEAQKIGATDMETGTRVEARRAPAVGAVDETVDPGDFFQLIDVVFVFDAAPTTSENITIVRVTGDADSLTEESYDPSLSTDLTHTFRFDKRFMDDATIDIDYANTDANTITVITTYQLDTSVA